MPKGKVETTKNGRRVRVTPTRKNKIGGRKSTRGAAHFTAEELRKVAQSDRTRDAGTARRELAKRGLPVEVETVEEAA